MHRATPETPPPNRYTASVPLNTGKPCIADAEWGPRGHGCGAEPEQRLAHLPGKQALPSQPLGLTDQSRGAHVQDLVVS